jgi:small subunit ribosomal protein S1
VGWRCGAGVCLPGFPHMSSIMQELLEQSSFDKLKEGSIVPGVITEIRQN